MIVLVIPVRLPVTQPRAARKQSPNDGRSRPLAPMMSPVLRSENVLPKGCHAASGQGHHDVFGGRRDEIDLMQDRRDERSE